MLNVEGIAKLCHQVNKAYCESLGDRTLTNWDDAPQWQKDTILDGVNYHLYTEGTNPEDSHNNWLKKKEADGWVYGDVKDPEAKEHPCMVPFDELPKEQQLKDILFKAICDSFK